MVPDILFFVSILFLQGVSSIFSSLTGYMHPLSYLGLACFFSWLAWHYIGQLYVEFEAYKKPDARKSERVAGKIFEIFLLLFALFVIGQGFFVFQIIQPVIEPAGLAGITGILRVMSFLFPAASALAGWLGRKKTADGKAILDWLWVLPLMLMVPYIFAPYKPLFFLGHGGNTGLLVSDIVIGIILRLIICLGIPFGLRAALRFLSALVFKYFHKENHLAPGKQPSPWPEIVYSLLVSLVLYFWLKALLDLYVPASLESEALFRIEFAMLGILAFGPIPIRLVMAFRPPLRFYNSIVSLILLGWLVFDAWGTVSSRQNIWLKEPIDDARIASLPYSLPHHDSFDTYDKNFWLYYDGSSRKLEIPTRPVIEGSLILRPEAMNFFLSPSFAIPGDGVIEITRLIKVDARIGSSFYTQLDLYLSDSERQLPGINTSLRPAFILEIDCMTGIFTGTKGAAVNYTGIKGEKINLAELALGQIVEERLIWNSRSGKGEYHLDGIVFPFTVEPVEASVYRLLLKANGDSSHRLYIDSIKFGDGFTGLIPQT